MGVFLLCFLRVLEEVGTDPESLVDAYMMRTVLLLLASGVLLLGSPTSSRADVVISEFLSSNTQGLKDEDGEFSDWIELHNTGTNTVDLDNWYLTDTITKLTQWRFPATNVPPDGYLLVFASGKNRKEPGAPLHTNFKLSSDGEYLALVAADGKTVRSAFSPTYPGQVDDVSYGLDTGLRPVTLLSSNAVGKRFVPADNTLGLDWTAPQFNDSGWSPVTNALGYFTAALDYVPRQGLLDGLAGYWKFDETAGLSFADASGNGNGGTLSGFSGSTSPWIPGVSGGAVRFRGGNVKTLAKVPDYPKATRALTASAWVWADVRPAWASIAKNWGTNSGQFFLGLHDTAGDLEISIRTLGGMVTVREGLPISTGSWHHVAFTADGSVLRLFHNGVLVGSQSYNSDFVAGTLAPLGIGCRLKEDGSAADALQPGIWGGRIDDVAVWNRGLSSDEVLAIQDAGAGVVTTLKSDVGSLLLDKQSALYLRYPVTVSNPSQLVNWRLRLRYDDGVVMWVNGDEVLRRNAPTNLDYPTTAIEARPSAEVREQEVFNLDDYSTSFHSGTNILAVLLLNASAHDNDILFEPYLEAASTTQTTNQLAYFTIPTPGAQNRYGQQSVGPVIREVVHAPAIPMNDEDVTVTARVTPTFNPIANVLLRYRVMYTNEVSLPMYDDGTHGDAVANDHVFSARIPAAASLPGQMIRYAVVAVDSASKTNRMPLFPDRLKTEEYYGTVVADPALQSPLPIIQWFISKPSSADLDPGVQCSIFYDGEFYDNVYVRIRGGTSRGWPKTSHKMEFPDDHEFRIHPGVGTVTEFDLNTTYTDKSYVRAVMVSEHQLDAGLPSPETFHVRLQQNGKFYSVTLLTEQPDKAWLRRHHLDDQGSLYKGGPGSNADSETSFEKKTRKDEDNSDLKAFIKGIHLKGAALENYVFDSLDLPGQVNYMATVAVTQNIDGSDKNFFLYRDTNGTGEWRMFPWDLDLTFGPNALNTDTMVATENFTSHPFIGARPYLLADGKYNVILEAVVNVPRARQMLVRRIRTLVDAYLAKPYFQDKIERFAVLLAPDVALDKATWKSSGYFPPTAYTLREALDRIENEYLVPRLPYLIGTAIPGIGVSNVTSQPYAPKIAFGEMLVTPTSGDPEQEYLQLVNPNPYPVDISGWKLKGDVSWTFKAGTVIPTNSALYVSPRVSKFRTRATAPTGGMGLFVQGDYQGQLSARGGQLRLVNDFDFPVSETNYVGHPSAAQEFLRVTEVMYAPVSLNGDSEKADAYEYIELKNTSTTTALDLHGVRFTRGIFFDFTQGTVLRLAPGQRVLVVKNIAAFEQRYGKGKPVAGAYAGSLNNGRDDIRLEDAYGEKILEFSYDNKWYPITDKQGFSLVLAREDLPWDQFSLASSWRTSAVWKGTPGSDEGSVPTIPVVYVNEILSAPSASQEDAVELWNSGNNSAAIGGWYLSDDFNQPKKYRISNGTTIPALGYWQITSAAFQTGATGFRLGADGDEIWLFSADPVSGDLTGYVHGFRFGPIQSGTSWGRFVDSIGREQWAAQSAVTLGAQNSGPRVGPLVVTEIQYHPSPTYAGASSALEYIEVENRSEESLSLSPSNSGQTTGRRYRIRGGVDFDFPAGTTLSAGGIALLVGFDPVADGTTLAEFRAIYGISTDVPLFGPWSGKLANSGDRIVVSRTAGLPGTNELWEVVEDIDFNDRGLWPGADGDGSTLHRRSILAFANDPGQWVAASPSPGRPFVAGAAPEWVSQPISLHAVAFQDLQLQGVAQGPGPLHYQWWHDGNLLTQETNSQLLLNAISPEQFGDYRLTVFNAYGSLQSSNASVSLDLPAFVSQQPVGRNVKVGTNVTFSVTAFGTGPLHYQWRWNGQPLTGATNSLLLLTNVQLSQSGNYDVQVSDSIGSGYSDVARLGVFIPPTILQNPDAWVTTQGQPIRLAVVATGTLPLTYRWKRGSVVLDGQTNSVLLITNAQSANVGNYTVAVSNPGGSAGSPNVSVSVLADADRDGIADVWETANGLSSNDPNDAFLDPDQDGMNNLEESVAGTNPKDSKSVLQLNLSAVSLGESGFQNVISFQAVSNHTYAVLVSPDPGASLSAWDKKWSFSSRNTNWTAFITNVTPVLDPQYFRLQTPRLP